MRITLFFAAVSTVLVVPYRSHADTFIFAPRTNGASKEVIARFRVEKSTGQLKTLPGDTVVDGVPQPLTLVLSADSHCLYVFHRFDADTDGYSLDADTDTAKEIQNRPTCIVVFRVEADGALQQVQTLSVPGPVGQLAPHPGGRWIYALTEGGAFLIKNVPSTSRPGAQPSLCYVTRFSIPSGMGLLSVPGERDAWWLTFSSQGNYLYDFWGDGFVDHAENYLQRYKVNPVSGIPKPDGAQWIDAGERSKPPIPGVVWFFVSKTAFVKGFGPGFYAYPVDAAGRIAAREVPQLLYPVNNGMYGMKQTLTPHPKLPLVVYRGSLSDPYTIWRVTAPGKVAKVGTFPSAFLDNKWQTYLLAEPGGRFLYEASTGDGGKVSYAIWQWKPKGNGATLSTTPVSLPQGIGSSADWVLASWERDKLPAPQRRKVKR